MSNKINLKELEKKAYQSMFEDGLWDIFLGLMFLGGVINPILAELGIPRPIDTIITALVAVLIFYFGKKRITIPRVGRVKFGPKRQKARKKLRIAVIFFVIVTWTVFLLVMTRAVKIRPENTFSRILIFDLLFITVPIGVIAYFLDFDRLYVYAVLYGTAYPFAEFLHPIVGTPLDGIIAVGITGGIGVLTGLVYLIRFMRKYPKIKVKDYHSLSTEESNDVSNKGGLV
ncbi:MAG: hypothetical protein ACE5I5_12305 [Candidatus Heimdallarchaeota archaeon]